MQDVDDVLKFIEGSVSAAKESSEKRRAKKERQRAQRAEEARKREEQEELRKREEKMTSRENENQTKKTQATANSARQNLTSSRGTDKSMETITNKINSMEINKDSKSKSSNNTKSLEALKLKQMQELQQLQLMHLRQIHEQQLKIAMAEGGVNGVRMTEAAAKEEVCSQLECTHEETLEEICEYSTYQGHTNLGLLVFK